MYFGVYCITITFVYRLLPNHELRADTRDAEGYRLELDALKINHKRGWATIYLWLDTIEIQKCFSLLWFQGS